MGKEGEKYSVDLADGSEKLLFPTEKMGEGTDVQTCRLSVSWDLGFIGLHLADAESMCWGKCE